MRSLSRFSAKIERWIGRIEGCMRLFAKVSYMNMVNDRRKVEGKPPLYDEKDYRDAIQEEIPRGEHQ